MKGLSRELSDDDVPNKEADKKRAQIKDQAFNLARSEIQRAEAILKLSHTQADLMFDNARTLIRRVRSKGEQPRHVLEVVVEAQPTADAKGAVGRGEQSVKNPFPTIADLRFHLDEPADNVGHPEDVLRALVITGSPIRVPAHAACVVSVSIQKETADKLDPGLYFAHLDVYLSADVERCVARFLLKIRIEGTRRS